MNVNDIDAILIGEPVEAMEAAKRLIAQHDIRHVETLITIASNKSLRLWSRIAAIYTLGFIDDDGASRSALGRIGRDKSEPAQVKSHALEALENVGE